MQLPEVLVEMEGGGSRGGKPQTTTTDRLPDFVSSAVGDQRETDAGGKSVSASLDVVSTVIEMTELIRTAKLKLDSQRRIDSRRLKNKCRSANQTHKIVTIMSLICKQVNFPSYWSGMSK